MNLRQLRDGQVKDSIGRVIPLEVERGQATWIENGRQALTGRIEIFSVSAAVASSLSCQIPANNTCCPPETFEVFLAPNVLTTSVGSTSFLQFLERRRRECDGAMFGPFDVTAQAVWSSTNTAVATVGAVTTDGCQVNSVAPGHANVHADYNGASYFFDSTEPNCVLVPVPFPADCPIDVLPTVTASGPTAVPLGTDVNTIQLMATGDPAGGTFVWSTTSSLVTLTNTTSATVTVKSVAESMSEDDVTITVSYTLNTETASVPIMLAVQKPTFMGFVSINSNGPNNCPANQAGWRKVITWQVQDKFGKAMVFALPTSDTLSAASSQNGCLLTLLGTPPGGATSSTGLWQHTYDLCTTECVNKTCQTTGTQSFLVNGFQIDLGFTFQCNTITVAGH